jgi:hypothetical protein
MDNLMIMGLLFGIAGNTSTEAWQKLLWYLLAIITACAHVFNVLTK